MPSPAQRDVCCGSLNFSRRSTNSCQAITESLLSACAFEKPDSYVVFFFFLYLFPFVWSKNDIIKYEWTIWTVLFVWELHLVRLKTIYLLTVVPSWGAEGQMVQSQQVIAARMLMHWRHQTWNRWCGGSAPPKRHKTTKMNGLFVEVWNRLL